MDVVVAGWFYVVIMIDDDNDDVGQEMSGMLDSCNSLWEHVN
jgi:hypothetical protein